MGRALCRVRRLHPGVDGRYLPDRTLLEVAAQWTVRRIRGRALRDQCRSAVRVAVDLRSPEQHGQTRPAAGDSAAQELAHVTRWRPAQNRSARSEIGL